MADFKVTRYRIRINRMDNKPASPFSVVFLSDLHDVSYGRENERLLQEIRNQEPEAVFIGGDMIVGAQKPRTHAAVALMDELTKRYPVYCANGNHEYRLREQPAKYGEAYEVYSEKIRSFGVHLLENEHEKLQIRRMRFTIWGYELSQEYYGRWSRAALRPEQMKEKIGSPEDDSFHILLAHHPAYFDTYAAWGADLVLAGHYHGGMVRLPVIGGLISPQLQLLPPYSRGMFVKKGHRMIVSSGLGSHTIKLRINNPPELVVIDFL